jgi:uncharacterized cupin superfamily protein
MLAHAPSNRSSRTARRSSSTGEFGTALIIRRRRELVQLFCFSTRQRIRKRAALTMQMSNGRSSFVEPVPPCILIAGASEKRNINLLVPPPSISGRIATLSSLTHQFHVDHQPTADRSWTMFHAFAAATPIHDRITCHASVLAPGHSPHAPHAHMQEELLVVISGEVEICLPDGESDCDPRTERLRPGDFAYYPAYRWHTLRNVAQSPRLLRDVQMARNNG